MFLDVDECIVGSYFCDDICYNMLGSFICYCRLGFRLMVDFKICLGNDISLLMFYFFLIIIKFSILVRVCLWMFRIYFIWKKEV